VVTDPWSKGTQTRQMKHQPKQLELVSKLLHEETTLSLATTGEDGEASVAPLFYIAGYRISRSAGSPPRAACTA
jgi:hypothetical protein